MLDMVYEQSKLLIDKPSLNFIPVTDPTSLGFPRIGPRREIKFALER